MISVQEARKLITQNSDVLEPATVKIPDALGSVLSIDVISPISLPPFDQSAMDGYAIKFTDFIEKKEIKVIGEVAAGNVFKKKIGLGQAVRIFTGAPIPVGLDTVVMQEKTILKNEFLSINDEFLNRGSNIRRAGSQIKKGDRALTKGTCLTPGGIGYLAAMGINSVKVIGRPKVTIIITGSELKKPGKPLIKGEIYESNSFSLQAALQSIGLKAQSITTIHDSEVKTFNVLKRSIENSDLVLVTGGISVGDYDFVGKSLLKLGVENIFYKIKQKPGKPLFFGRKNQALIFGLPGNPAAVLSCFYEYTYPSLRLMQGHKDAFLPLFKIPISTDYKKKKGLSLFLKGKISDNIVTPLGGQESFILSSFAMADSLIYLPEESENIKKGELVEVHKLP